ncbi:MAG: threonine-phosphate decarboxylase [Leifsonia xyli]|nr:MAG: threonine-phosphate decarboxylase [Leifsonia xyli]
MSLVSVATEFWRATEAGGLRHGGDLAFARGRFPGAPAPWVDLSTGINPRSYPVGEIDAELWGRLPGAAALEALEAAAATAYGAPSQAFVAASPGTQALIQLLPRLVPARRVAILGYGYQEHPKAWRAAGSEVLVVDDFADLTRSGADVVVVVNPNNPDGRLVDPGLLLKLAARLRILGRTLIVDESFMDVMTPDASLAPHLADEATIVLRSFGKTYGLAGVRLGFALCTPLFVQRVKASLGPWAVSGPALDIGRRALLDRGWLDDAKTRLIEDAQRLDQLLASAGLEIVGGTPLFRLARSSDAYSWFERLGQSGVLVRPFAARPCWLRFGTPGDELAWARLTEALDR